MNNETIQISQDDIKRMQNVKQAIDTLTMQIGALELKKVRLVANLNEYHIASEKLVAEIIEKYQLPNDKKVIIDEQGFVKFEDVNNNESSNEITESLIS